MNKLVKVLLTGLFLAIITLNSIGMLVPLTTDAATLGVGPAQLTITDAVRGNVYQDTIFLKWADESISSRIELQATGDIINWVSFHNQNQSSTALKDVTPKTGEWTYLTVKFSIPKNTQLSTANGTLQAIAVPVASMGGAAAVSLMGKVDVTIKIGGVPPRIEGNVDKIAVQDAEVISGQPLNFQVYYSNKGNVNVEPKVNIRVTTGNSKLITEFSKQSNSVEAGKQQLIQIPLSTPGLPAGYYIAEVEVTVEEKVVGSKKLQLTLLPPISDTTGQPASQEVKADVTTDKEFKPDVTTDKGLAPNTGAATQSAPQEFKIDVTADRGLSPNSGAAAQSASQEFKPNEIVEKGPPQAPASQAGGISFPIINLAAVAALLVVFALFVRFQKRRA